ncbi:hypothetical protein ACIBJF_15760, partial [Streptomyces sp. NPDC050743]|uniref:hypothetical protein n=1 Tax=Streptomyces sp. NPDC050743 TaxID=3365634 RepID=UPI0037A500F3
RIFLSQDRSYQGPYVCPELGVHHETPGGDHPQRPSVTGKGSLTKLEHGQAVLGKGSGCSTAAAQKSVYESWERRVKDISDLCDGLAGVLEKVGHDQFKTDEAIKAEIAGLKGHSEDTSAVGGTGKGR